MRVTPETMWSFELRRPLVGTRAPANGFANVLEAAGTSLHAPTAHRGDGTSARDPGDVASRPGGARSLMTSSPDEPAWSGSIDIHGKPDRSHAVSTMTAEEEDRMFRLSGEIRGLGANAAVPPGSPAPPPGYFYDPATGYQPGFTLVYGDITNYINPIKGILKVGA
jgi:hypothetical protein